MFLHDGDGWVRCARGHRHWGRFGAAGLLLAQRSATEGCWLLLQHRAVWSHHGDTWGLPGGAMRSGETPEQAALREFREEVTLVGSGIRFVAEHDDDHGGWRYVSVVGFAQDRGPAVARSAETAAVRWVPRAELTELPLHPGLAETLPRLLALVDATAVD